MKMNQFKYRQSVVYAAATGAIALLTGLGLFWNYTREQAVPPAQEIAQAQDAQPQAPVIAQTDDVLLSIDKYVLKMDESQSKSRLSITKNNQVIIDVELPEGLSAQDLSALKTGMQFDTLEQIEAFLEAFDS